MRVDGNIDLFCVISAFPEGFVINRSSPTPDHLQQRSPWNEVDAGLNRIGSAQRNIRVKSGMRSPRTAVSIKILTPNVSSISILRQSSLCSVDSH
jgi:hypothetical protein